MQGIRVAAWLKVCAGKEVPRLRRCGFWLVLAPALTGWANFWRAYGAGRKEVVA